MLSSLGVGTYLGQASRTDDLTQTAALILSVHAGWNVIDTASNYRGGRAEVRAQPGAVSGRCSVAWRAELCSCSLPVRMCKFRGIGDPKQGPIFCGAGLHAKHFLHVLLEGGEPAGCVLKCCSRPACRPHARASCRCNHRALDCRSQWATPWRCCATSQACPAPCCLSQPRLATWTRQMPRRWCSRVR